MTASAPRPTPRLFEPAQLGRLRLKNRLLKAATFEGMARGGLSTPALADFHRRVAQGGAALCTVAYAAVSPDGRSYPTQIVVSPAAAGSLAELATAIHEGGAAACLQVGHCGNFSARKLVGGPTLGPSRLLNLYDLSMSRAMDEHDIAATVRAFADAARLSAAAGFDAVELHFGHGYLVSQFLSAATNRRTDRFGGNLDGRMRLARQILEAVRAAAPELTVILKLNLRDGFVGGLELDESIAIARTLAAEGADALALSGGFVSKAPLYMLRGEVPIRDMVAAQTSLLRKIGLSLFGRFFVPAYPFSEGFFLDAAAELRRAVDIPVIALGGLGSRAIMEHALALGLDFIGLGRALVYDANFVARLERGEVDATDCIPCNRCIAEMDKGALRCPVAPQ